MKQTKLDRDSEIGHAVRSSAILPYSWEMLTDQEVITLVRKSRSILRRKNATRAQQEAALLISLACQTALPLKKLTNLTVRIVDHLPDRDDLKRGIYVLPEGSYLVLETGATIRAARDYNARRISNETTLAEKNIKIDSISNASSSHKDKMYDHPCHQYKDALGFVIIPTFLYLDKFIRFDKISIFPELIFMCQPYELLSHVNQIMKRHKAWRGTTTKANRRLRSLSAWLVHRLQTGAGGDPAYVHMLGVNYGRMSESLLFYATLPHASFLAAYKSAVGISKSLALCKDYPIAKFVGSSRHPNTAAVSMLLRSLRACLNRPIISYYTDRVTGERRYGVNAERHLAMTLYTYAFVTFATGQRGLTSPPGLRAVDLESGFAAVTEKIRESADRRPEVADDVLQKMDVFTRIACEFRPQRMVWYCPGAIAQLHEYEQYLDEIHKFYRKRRTIEGDAIANSIAGFRQTDRIPLFLLTDAGVKRITP